MCHSSRKRSVLILVAMFIVIVCTSCAGATDIVITFDGNECTFDGPTEVETGDQIIKIRNTSGAIGSMDLCRIFEGYDWQDTLDFIGEPGSEVGWPTYCPTRVSSKVVDANENEVTHEFKLRYPGEHHVMWKETGPLPEKTWPCASFAVIEAATE